ncbi:hypothetical protein FRC10_002985 [Ceratobasidium sp. 414]|nr:hypothetical protein FRC10_002985 [Ceratobasidium sp. 414]
MVPPGDEIISHLTAHGCADLTHDLHPPSASNQPTAHGGFGSVYKEKLRDGRQVAIKALRVSFNADDEADKLPKVIQPTLSICKNLIPYQRAARELYTWSKCQHPNVLSLLGLAKVQDQIRMVSLWMDNGSLPSYLDNEGVPMITDFGNAVLQQGTLQFTETAKQSGFTPRWTAPEVLEDKVKQSKEADVFALGMTILVLVEIITGKVPYFYINNIVVLIRAIAIKNETPKRPEEHIPPNSQHGDALWSLLQSCWEFEPEKRLGAANVAEIMKGITREGLVPVPAESEGQAEADPAPEAK